MLVDGWPSDNRRREAGFLAPVMESAIAMLPQTAPPQWVATGATAITVMRRLLPYLRISAHAVEVFL